MNPIKKLFVVALILISLFIGGIFAIGEKKEASDDAEVESSASIEEQKAKEEVAFTTLKTFTADEFKQAYDNLSLPNITPIISPPSITSSAAADTVIRQLAENRGYKLRDVASGILNTTDDIEVQELLISSWQDMKQAALEAGHLIEVYSGYRSIDEQNELFIQSLFATGITESEIASSSVDATVDQILQLTAPPGYSRHHSGYTIDVEDPNYFVFAESPAYLWMSDDNFANTKRFGFIPSYPDGATNQGPNPEPWEYVWVGQSVTYE